MKTVYGIEYSYRIELNMFDYDWEKSLSNKIFKTKELAEEYLAQNGYAKTDDNEYTKTHDEKASLVKFKYMTKL